MKNLATVFLLFFAILSSSAQGKLNFNEDKHDFGMVDEGNLATHEFEFVNTGTAPLILSDVRASCGCTTPSWTKEPVAPGGKGIIKASFNSEGRPGIFVKTVTVTSNSTEPSKVLYIKGIVDPKKEKVAYTAAQLKSSPKLNLDKASASLGKIEKGQKVNAKFIIKNSGKEPLVIKSVQAACNCITHKLTPETIPAGKSGTLELTYSPTYDGKNNDIVVISSNDLNKPRTEITLQSEVVESLTTKSPIQEDKASPFSK